MQQECYSMIADGRGGGRQRWRDLLMRTVTDSDTITSIVEHHTSND